MISNKEKETIEDVHEFMSYKKFLVHCGNGKIAQNIDYLDIPKGATILLFGGYKMAGFHCVDAINSYKNKYGEYPNIIMTGQDSNKIDNTAGFGSEVGAYQHILINCEIPKDVVKRFFIDPKDTDTAQNIKSVEQIVEKFPILKDKSIVLFTQSYYCRRAIHDFVKKMPNQTFLVANCPKPNLETGIFYTDNYDGRAVDTMLGACFYHCIYNNQRFENGETLAPTKQELENSPNLDKIVPILERYYGWLYPNNLVDLGIAKNLQTAKEMIEQRRNDFMKTEMFSPLYQQKLINQEIKRRNK